MNRFTTAGIGLLLSLVGLAAGAQGVYRCGDSRTYTDKPCDGATQVDLRSNILDAGPRDAGAAAAAQPAPAIILPDTSRPAPAPSGGSMWDRKAQRDAEHNRRTYSN